MSKEHGKPIEVFMSLDLEMAQPSKRIIQIGACVGNIRTGQIFDKISLFVNPQEKLTPFIMDLTKIKQEDVDNGYTLEEAYRKLQKMHENYGCFINSICWGGGDSIELLEQLKQNNPHFEGWCFGRRWIDTKTLFISWRLANGRQVQGGLAKAMTKVGLKFIGQKHNAMDDSVNTFHMYCKMLGLLVSNDGNERC
jgi:inhibitor of KinA sporulation pathway (predicted exonuclease)